MHKFLWYHYVFMNVSIWEKSSCIWRHKSIHTHLHYIKYNSTKGFINWITNRNWNKAHFSLFNLLYLAGITPQNLNAFTNTISNNIPRFLEEAWKVSIRPWGLSRAHVKDFLIYFFTLQLFIKLALDVIFNWWVWASCLDTFFNLNFGGVKVTIVVFEHTLNLFCIIYPSSLIILDAIDDVPYPSLYCFDMIKSIVPISIG